MKEILNKLFITRKLVFMKKYCFFAAKFILILTYITTADAAVYYVSLTGSDSNSGIIDQPFRTIKYAVSKVKSGDTLYVRGGDYRENFPEWDYGDIDGLKGTSSRPIIISAYQQEMPIFSKLRIKNSEWLVLIGFQVTGYQPLLNNWEDLPEVIIDDQSVGSIDPNESWNTRESKVHQKYATYMKLRGDFEKTWTYGVAIKNTHNCIIENNEISKVWAGIHVSGGSSNNRIQKNIIHHTVDAMFTWGDAVSISAENNHISNNHFYQNFNSSVRLLRNAKGNIVENNLSEYNGISHMSSYSGGSNNVFRNNTLTHAGYYAETMSYPGPSGISIHSAGSGNVVEGNFIAYQLDVTGNDGGGIITDYTDNQTIIRNNILYRNMGHGFTSTFSGKNIIVHNLFIENGHNSNKAKFGIAMARKIDIDNIITNNIFYKNKTGGMSFNGLISLQEYVDYNLFYQPGTLIAADKYWDSNTHYSDLSSYRHSTGLGTHSIDSDPRFLDPDIGDFRLSALSPAIDTATPLHSATNDKNGRARPSGNGFDIGPYEYFSDTNQQN